MFSCIAVMSAMLMGRGVGGPAGLDQFLGQLSSSFASPGKFRELAGATFFDDVPAEERAGFGKPRVISVSADGTVATVLLSVSQKQDNSGDQTWTSAQWSGIYQIQKKGEQWQLGARLPRSSNHLYSHDIATTIDPMEGVVVDDRMKIRMDGPEGYYLSLNMNAKIESLKLDSKEVEYDFQNGILWFAGSIGEHELSIKYRIKVERPVGGGNSSAFGPECGHLRSQFYWLPVVGFGEATSLSQFKIVAKIPEQYQFALDIPQKERLEGGMRIVEGVAPQANYSLTVSYDKQWVPRNIGTRGIGVRVFATKDFQPSDEVISESVSQMVEVLVDRFGKPAQNYEVKILQTRSRGADGWFWLSNQGIYAGRVGANPVRAKAYSLNANLAHEVSHLWTNSVGWARFFLLEGWATYAESLLFGKVYGPDAERQFWRDTARKVTANDFMMSMTLKEDTANNGLSYWKGAWLLRMTENLIGRMEFDEGIRRFVNTKVTDADYEGFLKCFGTKRPTVERFLAPWIDKAGVPQFTAQLEGNALTLRQKGALYWLPKLVVRVDYADGSVEFKRVDVAKVSEFLKLKSGSVRRIEIDPSENFMLDQRLFEFPTKGNGKPAGNLVLRHNS